MPIILLPPTDFQTFLQSSYAKTNILLQNFLCNNYIFPKTTNYPWHIYTFINIHIHLYEAMYSMDYGVWILIFCDLFENRGGLADIIRVHSIFELKNVFFRFLIPSLKTLVRDKKKVTVHFWLVVKVLLYFCIPQTR